VVVVEDVCKDLKFGEAPETDLDSDAVDDIARYILTQRLQNKCDGIEEWCREMMAQPARPKPAFKLGWVKGGPGTAWMEQRQDARLTRDVTGGRARFASRSRTSPGLKAIIPSKEVEEIEKLERYMNKD